MRFSAAFFRPMGSPALAGLLGAVAMLAVPGAAFAQSCQSIPREIAVLKEEIRIIKTINPGITTAYILCSEEGKLSAKDSDYSACIITFCIPADSYLECLGVSNRLANKVDSISRLATHFDANCS